MTATFIPPVIDNLTTSSATSSLSANQGVVLEGQITAKADNSAFVASGASHASGLVPDPGASAGTTKYLREDATFAVPPATVASGTSGRVPYETTGGVLIDSANFTFDGTQVGTAKLGIGTSTPGQLLEISGTGVTNTGQAFVQVTASANFGAGITLDSTAAGGKKYTVTSGGHGTGTQSDDSFNVFNVTDQAYLWSINSSRLTLNTDSVVWDTVTWPKQISFTQGSSFKASVKGVAPGDGTIALALATSAAGVETEKVRVTGAGRVAINRTAPGGQLDVNVNDPATKGLIVQGAASQTANLQEWQNSSGTGIASVDSSGTIVGTSLKMTSGTSGRIPFETTGGLLTDGTNLTVLSTGGLRADIGDRASGSDIALQVGGGNGGAYDLLTVTADGSFTWKNKFGVSWLAYSAPSGGLTINSSIDVVGGSSRWSGALRGASVAGYSNFTHILNLDVAGTGCIVTANASDVVLAAKGAASQTGNLQEWQNSAGTALASIAANGDTTLTGMMTLNGVTGRNVQFIPDYSVSIQALQFDGRDAQINQFLFRNTAAGLYAAMSADSSGGFSWETASSLPLVFRPNGVGVLQLQASSQSALLTAAAATVKALVVKGAASQTANLQEWQNSSATVLSKVDAIGALHVVPGTQASGATTVFRVQAGASGYTSDIFTLPANGYFSFNNQYGTGSTFSFDGLTFLFQDGTFVSADSLFARTSFLSASIKGYLYNATHRIDLDITGSVVQIPIATTTDKGLVIKGAASQTGNLQEWQNSSGTVLLAVGANGYLYQGSDLLLHTVGGASNFFAGVISGNPTLTGTANVGVGYGTLAANTTGANNAAIGAQALYLNTTGYSNVAIGFGALYANTVGPYNVAVGEQALGANTTGSSNLGLGYLALQANTTGSSNVGLGSQSLHSNTTGGLNLALGYAALYLNMTGQNNVALGPQAGFTATPANANVTGNNNTYVGYNSGPGVATQLSNSTAIGAGALCTASNQIVLGTSAETVVIPGQLVPPSLADSAAANGTLYYSTTAGKLVFKDAGGTVNALY